MQGASGALAGGAGVESLLNGGKSSHPPTLRFCYDECMVRLFINGEIAVSEETVKERGV